MAGEPALSPLPAGPFSAWLDDMRAALRGERDADVPCGECTACCTSGQFVHIAPDETDTLAHIPRALLFPAPMAPKGHVLMGYDEHGRCPMLIDGACSIYAHRPRTCRIYDCRVFPAAAVDPDADKPLIARQARRWVFDHATEADRARHTAVQATAVHLRQHPEDVPGGRRLTTATQLAVAAVELSRSTGSGPAAAGTG